MNAVAPNSLYKEVVRVTQTYFGPAADRFVARQVRYHLSKEPQALRPKDLTDLIDWMTLAMAMLIEDERLINKYTADLKGLTAHPNNGI